MKDREPTNPLSPRPWKREGRTIYNDEGIRVIERVSKRDALLILEKVNGKDKFITLTLPDHSTMIIEMYVGSGLFISHKPVGKKWDYYEQFVTEGFTDREIRGEDYAE